MGGSGSTVFSFGVLSHKWDNRCRGIWHPELPAKYAHICITTRLFCWSEPHILLGLGRFLRYPIQWPILDALLQMTDGEFDYGDRPGIVPINVLAS